MHRRARHLTGRAANAKLYYDARRISGESDGNAIQTWTDLSSAANNATQATSTKRPLYKVNIQGGCPMLKFDGSDDQYNTTSVSTVGSACSIVIVGKTNNINLAGAGQPNGKQIMFYYGNANVYSPNYNWVGIELRATNTASFGNYNSPTEASVIVTGDSNMHVYSGVINDSGTNRFLFDGVQQGTSTSQSITISSSAKPAISAFGDGTAPFYLDGYIGVVAYWSELLSASLRRRFEQACGFQYKLACS